MRVRQHQRWHQVSNASTRPASCPKAAQSLALTLSLLCHPQPLVYLRTSPPKQQPLFPHTCPQPAFVSYVTVEHSKLPPHEKTGAAGAPPPPAPLAAPQAPASAPAPAYKWVYPPAHAHSGGSAPSAAPTSTDVYNWDDVKVEVRRHVKKPYLNARTEQVAAWGCAGGALAAALPDGVLPRMPRMRRFLLSP